MAALPLIVFDVNETLLDLETMQPTFERIFGDKSAMRRWFADLSSLLGSADRSRRLRTIYRYRRGGDENAGGYARN
jgi:hypothetical protein